MISPYFKPTGDQAVDASSELSNLAAGHPHRQPINLIIVGLRIGSGFLHLPASQIRQSGLPSEPCNQNGWNIQSFRC